jgi:hypothetical protein
METHNDPAKAVASETTPPDPCAHNGLVMIHRVFGGYVARCLACKTIGPVVGTSEETRGAILGRG